MKKVVFSLSLFFIVGIFASGQEFGAIKGLVKDTDGSPLPGVNITLTGSKIGTMAVIASDRGNFRFLNLPVATDYTLKLELPGFNTHVQENIVVSFGKDVNFDITLKVAVIEEAITVVAENPVIDTKRAQVGVNITEEMIMELYSDLEIEARYKYSRSPSKQTIERLLAEIWNSGFLIRNEKNKEEIIDNIYGIFRKSNDDAYLAERRAFYIIEKGQKDRILLNKKLFQHLQVKLDNGITFNNLDKYIKATLVHELFHDFWYNLLNSQERYLFSKESKKFYEEIIMAKPTEDKLNFLSNIGWVEPTEENFASYESLIISKKEYSDQKFFGTELYAIIAKFAFMGKIIIPKQLRKFYACIISETTLNKSRI